MQRSPPNRISSSSNSNLHFISKHNHKNSISVPNSPILSDYAPSILGLLTKDYDEEEEVTFSYQNIKSSVLKKFKNLSKGVKNVNLKFNNNNNDDSLSKSHLFSHSTESKLNLKGKGRRISTSTSDEIASTLRSQTNDNINKKEEETLSWIEMIRPARSSWDIGLQINTCKDGTQKVECFYDDKITRQKLKTMISTCDFDDILREGYVASTGTRLDTIRVSLTPDNVKMDHLKV